MNSAVIWGLSRRSGRRGLSAVAVLAVLAAGSFVAAGPVGAQVDDAEAPPPVANLRCIAEVGRVAFLWDAAEWPRAEGVSYDYEWSLPNGRTEGGNLRGITLVYRPGQYQLGGETSFSITVRYDLDAYNEAFSAREEMTCYIGGVKPVPEQDPEPGTTSA